MGSEYGYVPRDDLTAEQLEIVRTNGIVVNAVLDQLIAARVAHLRGGCADFWCNDSDFVDRLDVLADHEVRQLIVMAVDRLAAAQERS